MSKSLSPLTVLLIMTAACQGVTTLNENGFYSAKTNNHTSRSILLDNSVSRSVKHIYTQCADSEDFFWCTKVQAAKLLGRALKVQSINIIDGFTITKKTDWNDTRTGRASNGEDLNLSNRDIENLSTKSLDAMLFDRFYQFAQSRQVQINLPRMLSFGQRNSQDFIQDAIKYFLSLFSSEDNSDSKTYVSEGRKKKDDKKYLGPFIAAVLLKTAILKLAYHSIAIVAGKALIVGKIALIISAIIGLKKLVSSEGGEKTTYEIVKHPQVQQSHTYSSSHTGEYEGGHESSAGSYHRSIDDEMMMQDKAYHAWVPTNKIS